MKKLQIGIMVSILLNLFDVSAQLSFQTGYDFGFITKQKKQNLHRLIFNPEYTFENNIVVSLFIGRDFYRSNRSNSSFSNCTGSSYIYKVNYFSTLTGLSFGYGFEITENSSFLFKLSAEGYFFDKWKIKESIRTTQQFPSNCDGSIDPLITETRFLDGANSYNNRFGTKGNRDFIFPLLTFSLEYRINIDPIDLIFHLGASPESNNLYENDRVIRGNYIFTGFRLGYTLPQKTNKNEK